jgi:phosphoserine phosphatase RsbU/P
MAKILAIDDDPRMRDLLDVMLRRKGHHVLTADHGQKGVDVFKRERPHVTILDFEMPVWMASLYCERFVPLTPRPQ